MNGRQVIEMTPAHDDEERFISDVAQHAAQSARPSGADLNRARQEAQRSNDAALADAVEVVKRHRARIGRNVCSPHDAAAIRQISALLNGLVGADGISDSDPAFGGDHGG